MTIKSTTDHAHAAAAIALDLRNDLLGGLSATSLMRRLEPRTLFDGAAVATAAVADAHHDEAPQPAVAAVNQQVSETHAAPAAAATPELAQAIGLDPAMQVTAAHPGAQVVFIDAAVGDRSALLSSIPAGAEVVTLEAGRDGVAQIAEYLSGRHDVAAIHILSHGGNGDIALGNSHLSATTLSSHASELAAIGQALAPGGDILIYGCDVAKDASGQDFIAQIARLTGADVAASKDDTGTATYGGNWTLEANTGLIETAALAAPEWHGILAPLTISATTDPITGGGNNVGAFAVWENAGFIGTTAIDVRATVVAADPAALVVFLRNGDDLWLACYQGNVTVKWEIFQAGTNQTVVAYGNPHFAITDIDGLDALHNAAGTPELEAVSPDLHHLTAYTLDNPTNLLTSITNGNLTVQGTVNQASEPTSLVEFQWSDVSSWQITYTALSNYPANRNFFHDGNGGFTFTDPRTTYLLGLDLDANNSAATGTAFQATYTENGPGVGIVDGDIAISQHSALGTTIDSASVVLANAQAGDQLLVGGSSNASGTVNGLAYTMTSSGGQIAIELSGNASLATYQAALKAITFNSTSENPAAVDRLINISVTNDTFGTTSNETLATIHVVRVNDAPVLDLDGGVAGTSYSATFTETGAVSIAAPSVSIADPDNTTMASAIITLTDAQANDVLSAGTMPAGITASAYNATTHTITLTGSATLAAYQSAIQAITFSNTSSDPSPADRHIDVTVSDGALSSNTATTTIHVLPLGLAPHLDLSGPSPYSGAFLYGHSGPGSYAAAQFGGPFASVGNEVAGSGVTLAYDGSSVDIHGVSSHTLSDAVENHDYISMTFTTNSTIPETWIQNTVNRNTNGTPYQYAIAISTDGFKTATLLSQNNPSDSFGPSYASGYPWAPATDYQLQAGQTYEVRAYIYNVTGGAAATARWDDFYVFYSNDPTGRETTFTENGAAVAIAAPTVEIEDVNNVNMAGGTVTLTNKQTADRLLIGGAPVGAGATGTVNGIAYTVSETAGSVTIALSGSASKAAYMAALNAITFENTSETPAAVDRIVTVTVTDGAEVSNVATTTIHVVPVNDAPLVDLNSAATAGDANRGNAVTFTENGAAVAVASATLADVNDFTEADISSLTIVAGGVHDGANEKVVIAGKAFDLATSATQLLNLGGGTLAIIDFDAATGTFSITNAAGGVLPQSMLDTLVRSVTYQDQGENPTAGDRTLTFTATDAAGLTSPPAVATIHVVAVNDAPVTVADVGTIAEDTTLTIAASAGVLGNDTDVDGGALSVTQFTVAGVSGSFAAGQAANIPSVGVLTLQSDGSYIFVPAKDFNGTVPTVTYSVSDGNAGGLATGTLTIKVTPVNDPPTVDLDIVAAGSGVVTTFTENGPGVSIAAAAVAVTDPDNTTLVSATITLTDAQAADVLAAGTMPSGIVASAYDPVSHRITLTGSASAAAYQVAIQAITFANTSDTPAVADRHVSVTVNDGALVSNAAVATIHVVAVNDSPIAVADAGHTNEDANLVVGSANSLLKNDSDPEGNPLVITSALDASGHAIAIGTATTLPSGAKLTLNADGTYTYKPNGVFNSLGASEAATETFSYTVSDGQGGTTSTSVTITIDGRNDAPTAGVLPAAAAKDGDPVSLNLGSAFHDPDATDVLTYTVSGLPAGLTFDPATGIVTGTLPADASQNGLFAAPGGGSTYQITVSASDGTSEVSRTFNYTIKNPPPVAADDAVSVPETTAVAGSVLADNGHGPDVDGVNDSDPLTVSSAKQGATSITLGQPFAVTGGGVLTLNPDGSYAFDPGTAYNGLKQGQSASESVSYTIADGQGGASTATLVLTINGANDAPVVINPANPGSPANPIPASDPLHVIADVATTDGATPAPVNVAAIIKDPDGEPLVFSAQGLPSGMAIDPNTGIISGSLGADASAHGPYTVAVTATDPHGASISTSVVYNVINLPPVAVNDATSVSEDGPAATGNLLTDPVTGDHDTGPDSDPLTVSSATQGGTAVTLGQPFKVSGGGMLTLNADGQYSFDPGMAYDALKLGQVATETISYTISDGNGGTATALLVLTVQGVNDAPVAVADTFATDQNTPVIGNVLRVNGASADSDVEGDVLTVSQLNGQSYTPGASVTLPSGANLMIKADGTFSYDPSHAFQALGHTQSQTDSFTYQVSDGHGGFSTATATVTVQGLDDPLAITGLTNGSVPQTAATVYESDLASGSNPSGNGATATGLFTLTAGDLVSTLNVNGIDLSAVGQTFVGAHGVLTITGITQTSATSYDLAYSYTLTSPADHSAGSVTENFSLTLLDSDGDAATGTLAIAIVDDHLTAVDDSAAMTEDQTTPLTGSVLGNDQIVSADGAAAPGPVVAVAAGDTCAEGNGANVGVAINGLYGSLTLNADGTYSYVLDATNPVVQALAAGQSLSETFTYQIADAEEAGTGTTTTTTSTASFASISARSFTTTSTTSAACTGTEAKLVISIAGVNDAPVAAPDTLSTDQNSAVAGQLLADNGSGADTDIEGDVLTVTQVNGKPFTPGEPILLTTGSSGSIDLLTGADTLQPAGGLLTVNADGTFSFDPNHAYDWVPEGQTANVMFSYEISDEHGGFATTSVTIEIQGKDDPLTIAGLGDGADAGTDGTVFESALATGSATGSGGDTITGSFTINVGDLYNGMTIGGSPLAAQSYTGAYGTLTITGVNSVVLNNGQGVAYELAYTYTLNGPADHAAGAATDVFALVLRDGDNDQVTANLVIAIADDKPVAANDAATATEDQVALVTGSVLGNDIIGADGPAAGGAITGVVAGAVSPAGSSANVGTGIAGSFGLLTLHADGTYAYALDNASSAVQALAAGQVASETFTYELTDSDGGHATATLTIVVSGVNDAPAAADDAVIVPEDGPAAGGNVIAGTAGSGLGADLDVDGDALSVIGGSQGGNALTPGQPFTVAGGGVLTLNADGSFVFDPGTAYNGLKEGQSASEVVSYTVADGHGGVAMATLTLTVAGANDAPVVIDPTHPGTAANPIPAGDPAHVLPAIATTDGATPAPVDVSLIIKDPDGEPMTFVAAGLPPGMSIDPNSGVITGTLPADASQLGPYTVVVTATDPHGASVSTEVIYRVINLPPVAIADSLVIPEDGPAVAGNVLTDPETGDQDTAPDSDPLHVASAAQDDTPIIIGQPVKLAGGGVLTLNADGSYLFDPGSAYGHLAANETAVETVTYVVSDGNGGTATTTLKLSIQGTNDAPAVIDPATGQVPVDPANIIPAIQATDGTPVTTLDVKAYFADPDTGETPRLVFSADPAILPPGLTLDPATGILSGTPGANVSQGGDPRHPGHYVIAVTATDPHGASVTTNLALVISNDPPVAKADTLTGGQNEVLTGNVLTDNGAGPDHDGGGDSDALEVLAVAGRSDALNGAVPGGTGGTFTIKSDGSITFDPGTDFIALGAGESRVTTISYTIADGQGGLATAIIAVTVTGSNDAPLVIDPASGAAADPATVIPTQSTSDGVTIAPLDVGAVFKEPDATDRLIFTAQGLPSGLVIDPSTGVITGTVDPAASVAGPYHIVVTATDRSDATASVAFDWSVSDPAPIALDDHLVSPEKGVIVAGNVFADNGQGRDHDGGADSDPLHVSAVNGAAANVGVAVSGSAGGSFVIQTDGALAFDPGLEFQSLGVGESKLTSITYTVDDGQGGTSTATVMVRVDGANDAPVVVDPVSGMPADPASVISVQQGSDAQSLTPINAALAFKDPDATDTLTFSATNLPAGLSIDPTSGLITGTLDHSASVAGPYHVVVTATDSHNAATAITFDIIVANPLPTADNATVTTSEDQTIAASVSPLPHDADGDPLTFSLVQAPAHGTLTLNPDGSFTYRPAANFNGAETFIYSVSDGEGGVATATVTLNVNAVNDAPVIAAASPVHGDQDHLIPLPGLTVGDVDAANPVVTVTLSTMHGQVSLQPMAGITVTTSADGHSLILTGTVADINANLVTLGYKADFGFHGSDALEIVVNDLGNVGAGGPLTAATRVDIQVDEVPRLNISSVSQPSTPSTGPGAPDLAALPDHAIPEDGGVVMTYPNNTYIHFVVTGADHIIDMQYGVGPNAMKIHSAITQSENPVLDNAGVFDPLATKTLNQGLQLNTVSPSLSNEWSGSGGQADLEAYAQRLLVDLATLTEADGLHAQVVADTDALSSQHSMTFGGALASTRGVWRRDAMQLLEDISVMSKRAA